MKDQQAERGAEDRHHDARLSHHLVGIVSDIIKKLVRGASFLGPLPAAVVQWNEPKIIQEERHRRPERRQISVLWIEPKIVCNPVAVSGGQMLRLIERR